MIGEVDEDQRRSVGVWDGIPCFRVVNSKGMLADTFVFGGKDVQKERLEKDGIEVLDNKVNLKIYQWKEE